jgi:hypothetical protein
VNVWVRVVSFCFFVGYSPDIVVIADAVMKVIGAIQHSGCGGDYIGTRTGQGAGAAELEPGM